VEYPLSGGTNKLFALREPPMSQLGQWWQYWLLSGAKLMLAASWSISPGKANPAGVIGGVH
jgi:hypothetical protein